MQTKLAKTSIYNLKRQTSNNPASKEVSYDMHLLLPTTDLMVIFILNHSIPGYTLMDGLPLQKIDFIKPHVRMKVLYKPSQQHVYMVRFSLMEFLRLQPIGSVSSPLNAVFEAYQESLIPLYKKICNRPGEEVSLTLSNFFKAQLRYESFDLISRALAMIHGPLPNRKINFLAAKLKVSERHFRQQFKKAIGVPPKQYLSTLMLEEALRYYCNDCSYNLTKIAYEAEFSDQSHFTRTFKKKIGLPPHQFFKTFGQQFI